MLSSLKRIDVTLFIESHSIKLDKTLLFCNAVDLSAKNLLKKLAFNLKVLIYCL